MKEAATEPWCLTADSKRELRELRRVDDDICRFPSSKIQRCAAGLYASCSFPLHQDDDNDGFLRIKTARTATRRVVLDRIRQAFSFGIFAL